MNSKILSVQSDLNIQNEICSELKNHFKTIYKSSSANDGYKKFKIYKPEIIICDSFLINGSTFDMVLDIRDVDADVFIVVTGYKNDDYLLLESLDINNLLLLEKPINIKNLRIVINKLLNNNITTTKEKFDTRLFNDIKKIAHKKITLINDYKGIVLNHEEKIISVLKDTFLVKASKLSKFAIKNKKSTVIEYEGKYILVYLHKINKNNILEFKNPKYINFINRKESKRLSVDKSFQAGMFYKNEHIDLIPCDISFQSCAVKCLDIKKYFVVGDSFDLTFGFEIPGIGACKLDMKFVKIFAKAYIKRVDKNNKSQKIILIIEVKKAGHTSLLKYLNYREMTTIDEIKRSIS